MTAVMILWALPIGAALQQRHVLQLNTIAAVVCAVVGTMAVAAIMGVYGFPTQDDRVAAQIFTGIGFLGASVIIKTGRTVFGRNTAATLLATAAVGALCSVWMWREAVAGAVIIVPSNGFLYPLAKWVDQRPQKPGHEKRADF